MFYDVHGMKLQRKIANKAFPIALITSIGFLVLYSVFGLWGFIDYNESGYQIGDVSGWCERVSSGIFREPINALSNIGFIIVGLLMFRVLSRDTEATYSQNMFHGLRPLPLLYASTVLFLGPGSLLMHGTHTTWGGWADNLSMVMYILVPWLINVKEMGRWSSGKFFAVYAVLVIFYAVSSWFFGSRLGIGLDVFGVSIAIWIISEILFRYWSDIFRWSSGFVGFVVAAVFGIMPWEILTNMDRYWWVILFWLPAILSYKRSEKTRRYPWYILGMYSYILAYIIWLQGYPDTRFCNPDSIIQPHALWHLLTALATWCFFKFLRTERSKNNIIHMP